MPEYLDLLNDDGSKSGEKKLREDIHRDGNWHRTVHVWLVNSGGKLLLQKRGANKASHPLYWDISAAGHIDAGENSLEAAQRECFEELGIKRDLNAFKFLFTLKNEMWIEGLGMDREFVDVYVIYYDQKTDRIQSDASEVEGVKWISHCDLLKMSMQALENVVDHREEYLRLVRYFGLGNH